MSKLFAFSFDEERFSGAFDTREEALAAAREEADEEGATVWTGSYEPQVASRYLSRWRVIDDLRDQAYDEAGDFADTWLERVSKEHETALAAALSAALDAWATETNNHPNFFTVEEIERA